MAGDDYYGISPSSMMVPYQRPEYRDCTCPRCRDRYETRELERENYELRRENRMLKENIYFDKRTFREFNGYYGDRLVSRFDRPEKSMNKLTVMAKKLLDADTKVFIKAGILDEDLEITEDGITFLLAQYLSDNKVALVEEAKRKLAEEKEEKLLK